MGDYFYSFLASNLPCFSHSGPAPSCLFSFFPPWSRRYLFCHPSVHAGLIHTLNSQSEVSQHDTLIQPPDQSTPSGDPAQGPTCPALGLPWPSPLPWPLCSNLCLAAWTGPHPTTALPPPPPPPDHHSLSRVHCPALQGFGVETSHLLHNSLPFPTPLPAGCSPATPRTPPGLPP